MFQQLIVIKVAVIAELAERVSSVTSVIWVSVCSVSCQFLTVVPLTLIGEDLKREMWSTEMKSEMHIKVIS